MNDAQMTPAQTSPLEAALTAAPLDVSRLSEILLAEFEALKIRDLTVLESVQNEKTDVLQRLAAVAELVAAQPAALSAWQQLQEPLEQCKQDHFRNIQLMQRQLQAVRGTLQALQGESASSLDLYDRMGQVSRRHGAWGYHLA